MTDEQIIKASENAIAVVDWAIDLINRQKAEIKLLERENKRLSQSADTAFQDGLDENRDLFEKEVRPEIVKEFADKIDELLARYSHLHNNAENAKRDTIEAADGTDIEMQSVWDVFTLKNNKMAEYEEMNGLQKNIEVIAKERLLKEIEKDFRLLVKEMTEVK